MAHIAYFRVSTSEQSTESQRGALLRSLGVPSFDREFSDEGVSGGVPAAQRPQFAQLLSYIREGDTLHVHAVDRLGRDAIDVQQTVRELLRRGVQVQIQGIGLIGPGAGELILAVLAQVADMEKARINERTAAGREAARQSLAATGKTHKGKASMGRPLEADPAAVRQWRAANGSEGKPASIAATAAHWKLSTATVKRYCATA